MKKSGLTAICDAYRKGALIFIIRAYDFYLTMSEKTGYQLLSQDTIKSILKSPSTAKFPRITDWKFKKEFEKVIIQSYVDSQNGFGAMIRSEFQFIIENGQITSLIFDGKELKK